MRVMTAVRTTIKRKVTVTRRISLMFGGYRKDEGGRRKIGIAAKGIYVLEGKEI